MNTSYSTSIHYITKTKNLFPLRMSRVLLAKFAMLFQFELFLHLFLVALGIVSNPTTFGTLHLRHIVFNLSHSILSR